MTAPLICPGCDRAAAFLEQYGPYDGVWYTCQLCGHECDELELRLANTEPATELVQ